MPTTAIQSMAGVYSQVRSDRVLPFGFPLAVSLDSLVPVMEQGFEPLEHDRAPDFTPTRISSTSPSVAWQGSVGEVKANIEGIRERAAIMARSGPIGATKTRWQIHLAAGVPMAGRLALARPQLVPRPHGRCRQRSGSHRETPHEGERRRRRRALSSGRMCWGVAASFRPRKNLSRAVSCRHFP